MLIQYKFMELMMALIQLYKGVSLCMLGKHFDTKLYPVQECSCSYKVKIKCLKVWAIVFVLVRISVAVKTPRPQQILYK